MLEYKQSDDRIRRSKKFKEIAFKNNIAIGHISFLLLGSAISGATWYKQGVVRLGMVGQGLVRLDKVWSGLIWYRENRVLDPFSFLYHIYM